RAGAVPGPALRRPAPEAGGGGRDDQLLRPALPVRHVPAEPGHQAAVGAVPGGSAHRPRPAGSLRVAPVLCGATTPRAPLAPASRGVRNGAPEGRAIVEVRATMVGWCCGTGCLVVVGLAGCAAPPAQVEPVSGFHGDTGDGYADLDAAAEAAC